LRLVSERSRWNASSSLVGVRALDFDFDFGIRKNDSNSYAGRFSEVNILRENFDVVLVNTCVLACCPRLSCIQSPMSLHPVPLLDCGDKGLLKRASEPWAIRRSALLYPIRAGEGSPGCLRGLGACVSAGVEPMRPAFRRS
jgi:hypothetical protein